MSSRKNILFLGPDNSPLLNWLDSQGEKVIHTSDIICPEYIDKNNVGFLISYGYRHILKQEVLEKLPNSSINLHISYLPWNRGSDPNFWSFLENTPKGVTIHYLDAGIDTGDIIVQKKVKFEKKNETLATTYKTLQLEIQKLFRRHWTRIKSGDCQRLKQSESGEGSLHKLKDKEPFLHLLTSGWDTPVAALEKHT